MEVTKKKPKVLLLSDDMRLNSGVATVSRELIIGTSQFIDWVQVGAAIKHPDQGKIIDVSKSIETEFGYTNVSVKIYPWDGYGNIDLIRQLINTEQPDCIVHFTDPRFWAWLYQAEHELRQHLPIFYISIWDNWPTPHWNKPFYKSCDMLMAISKQSNAIHKSVLKGENFEDWQFQYLPHGINSKVFRPLTDSDEDTKHINDAKDALIGLDKDFVVFYNARNIGRKRVGDVVLAFKYFCDTLTDEQRKKAVLLMHTQPVDHNGTDLVALHKALAPECNVRFSSNQLPQPNLNVLYNLADVTINLASNEGFGLGTAESIMAGTPIIVNVTGGLQDQCGFKDSTGRYLTVNDYSDSWGSNHDGKYTEHGEWAFPVFPKVSTLQGSVPTPYIFDDIADPKDAAQQIRKIYDMPRSKRKEIGLKGREHFMKSDVALNSDDMCKNFVSYIELGLQKWSPRKRFTLVTA